MQLPIQLKQAVESEAAQFGLAKLVKAASELSDNYRFRQGTSTNFINSQAHRLAYLTTRMPATYAAMLSVLNAVKEATQDLQIESLLDIGAGPGTATWAASQVFPTIERFSLIERDSGLITLGQKFAVKANNEGLQGAKWLDENLLHVKSFEPHSMVVCSYSLGELDQQNACELMKVAWRSTEKILIIIEPGTMKGFTLIHRLRDEISTLGGYIIAPCPHQNACPMTENDWCHFAARVERSSLHRKLKGGTLNYEDEKYSYLVIAKSEVKRHPTRIIRRPKINTGYVSLQLCTEQGLQELKITRSDKNALKCARKANWGDHWD